MTNLKAKLEDGELLLKFDGVAIALKVQDIFESLDELDGEDLADSIVWGWLLDAAARKLASEAHSSAGGNKKFSREWLLKVLDNSIPFSLFDDSLRELNDYAKNLIHHRILYWKLHHDQTLGDRVGANWLRDNGFKSNYTDNPDEYVELKAQVNSSFKKMEASVEAAAKELVNKPLEDLM